MSKLRIAVIGAGLIGRTHIECALKSPGVELGGVADPTPGGRAGHARSSPLMRRRSYHSHGFPTVL